MGEEGRFFIIYILSVPAEYSGAPQCSNQNNNTNIQLPPSAILHRVGSGIAVVAQHSRPFPVRGVGTDPTLSLPLILRDYSDSGHPSLHRLHHLVSFEV